MKPVYCNTTSITHNQKTGEVALSFAHIYTEHSLSVGGTGLTDVSAKLAQEEAHIILSREGFVALRGLIENVWTKMTE